MAVCKCFAEALRLAELPGYTPVTGRVNLQFRAEPFNTLNHPQFGYIYPYYGGTQFGQATMTLNDNLNLNPLYQQAWAKIDAIVVQAPILSE